VIRQSSNVTGEMRADIAELAQRGGGGHDPAQIYMSRPWASRQDARLPPTYNTLKFRELAPGFDIREVRVINNAGREHWSTPIKDDGAYPQSHGAFWRAFDAFENRCGSVGPQPKLAHVPRNKTRWLARANGTLELLSTFKVCGECIGGRADLVRVGGMDDGGYLLCQQALGNVSGIVSVGIRGSDPFGSELSARTGAVVHMYDCVHRDAPSCPQGEGRCRIVFHPVCVADTERGAAEWQTLGQIAAGAFPHGGDLVLKLDCEGCEWAVLDRLGPDVLVRFRAIVIELHYMEDRQSHPLMHRVMAKLLGHFRVVHTHGCNARGVLGVMGTEFRLPTILEVTLVRRDFSKPTACSDYDGHPLDRRIWTSVPEHEEWAFRLPPSLAP